jgi:hypothetical protein
LGAGPYVWGCQDDKKHKFLWELICTCDGETMPLLLGGDFNNIRCKEEKNNGNFNTRWPVQCNHRKS